MIDTIAERFPTIRQHIVGSQFITPKDIEDITGLTEGNIFQGELSLEQLFFNRPVPGWARVPHADPRPVDVRLGDAPGRRDHGRPRPDRGARGPEGRGRGREGGLAMASRSNVVVIGGGPQRAWWRPRSSRRTGRRVTVFERADEVGGDPARREFAPGFTAPGSRTRSAGCVGRSIEDLRLADHGLSLLTPAVRMFAPQPDGSSVTFWGDAARTARSSASATRATRMRSRSSIGRCGRSRPSSPT